MIYIFDIDGTIADITHRLHFIQQKPADWSAFFEACDRDTPIHDMIDLAKHLEDDMGAEIVLITGRSDEGYCREKTEAWLDRQEMPYTYLCMRKAGDHRADNIIKGELLDSFIETYKPKPGEIAGVFEDRDQVVAMYRARGLRVFQVADGKF